MGSGVYRWRLRLGNLSRQGTGGPVMIILFILTVALLHLATRLKQHQAPVAFGEGLTLILASPREQRTPY